MLQYLVILLDDTSVAYCHADNPLKERNLIPLETLKKGILFGMKHNLMIQFVFPDYALPKTYAPVIESIDNIKIYPVGCKPVSDIDDESAAAVEVADAIPENVETENLVLRMTFSEMLKQKDGISKLFTNGKRVNLCITDVEKFTDEQIEAYKQALKAWSNDLLNLYKQGQSPQFNLLTDRMLLDEMHNCEAGVNNITLAPNGKFYLCPSFYFDEQKQVFNMLNHYRPTSDTTVGDLENGLEIRNSQLLQIDHAPLCRNCDAYHCRRCLWLSHKLTWDINTPSHQQCVMAHLERNVSRDLLNEIRKSGEFIQQNDIKEISYLDPFDVRNEF